MGTKLVGLSFSSQSKDCILLQGREASRILYNKYELFTDCWDSCKVTHSAIGAD